MLVSKNAKICLTPNAKHKICVSPNANTQRKSVEYRLHWVPNATFLYGPVHLIIVDVDFIPVGSCFQWNMRLTVGVNRIISKCVPYESTVDGLITSNGLLTCIPNQRKASIH